jgi:ACS family tartrate transporter-like MFS transporter
MPSAYLGGAAAAAGIAFINSVGSLGGFFGPYIVGWASERFGNFSSGLYALGAVAFLGALVTVFAVQNRKATPSPEKARAAAAAS